MYFMTCIFARKIETYFVAFRTLHLYFVVQWDCLNIGYNWNHTAHACTKFFNATHSLSYRPIIKNVTILSEQINYIRRLERDFILYLWIQPGTSLIQKLQTHQNQNRLTEN